MDTPDLAPTEPTTLATPEEAGAPSTPTRRSLKLVVTLQPGEGQAYRALLALGADGCDPVLRCLEAETLPAILAAIPTLLTEAEARWAVQPRYPPTTASKGKPRLASPPQRLLSWGMQLCRPQRLHLLPPLRPTRRLRHPQRQPPPARCPCSARLRRFPMARIFSYDGREFPDPDARLSVDEVRQQLSQFFPELVNADTKETRRGEDTVYTFSKRIGTKGQGQTVVAVLRGVAATHLRVFELAADLLDADGTLDLDAAGERQPDIHLALVEADAYARATRQAVQALQRLLGG